MQIKRRSIEAARRDLKAIIGTLDLEALAALMVGDISVKALAVAEVEARQIHPQQLVLDYYDAYGNGVEKKAA